MGKTKAAKAKSQFREQLEDLGLSQRSFSRLAGVSAVTVNRWCSERDDALEVPQYARVLIASLGALEADRRWTILKSFGVTDAAAFPAVPPPRSQK